MDMERSQAVQMLIVLNHLMLELIFIWLPDEWKELYTNTVRAVKSGDILMERLDEAVQRILHVKLRLGSTEENLIIIKIMLVQMLTKKLPERQFQNL